MTNRSHRAWLTSGLAFLSLFGIGCGKDPVQPPVIEDPAADAGTPDAGTPSPTWADSRFETRWVAPGFGELFALATADLDGDGEEEVIYGGRGLAVVEPDGQRILWSSKWDLESSSDNSWATGIRVIPSATGDETPDLLVSNADNQIHLVDGATGAFVWTQTVPSQLYTTDIATVDADDDGVPDVFPALGTMAWSGATGELLWEADLPGPATFVTEARLDGDGRGDLLVAVQPPAIWGGGDPEGPPEEQFFGIAADGSVLFRFAPEAGRPFGVAAADLDGDGIDEGVFVTDLGEVWAMDAAGQVRWRTAAIEGALDKVVSIDVDGDGADELFVGGQSWVDGYVVVQLAADGSVVWTHRFDDPIWDLKKAGRMLLVASGEENIIGVRGKLTALLLGSQPVEQWSVSTPRPVRKIALLRRGGSTQVIVGQGDAFLSALDVATGEVAWAWSSGGYFWDMASGDLDGDGNDEVLRGDDFGYVSAFDAAGNPKWTVRPDVGNAGMITGIAIGDLDGDGQPEVVTTGLRAFQEDQGVVAAWSASGRQLWSMVFPNQMANVQIADLDGDGLGEVVVGEVGLETCSVTVLDRAGGVVWSTPLSACSEPILAVGDVDADGVPEIGYGERVMFTEPHVALLSADGTVRWHQQVEDETSWLQLREGAFFHSGFAPDSQGHVTRRSASDGAEVWRKLLAPLPSAQFEGQTVPGSIRFATSVPDLSGDGEDELAVSSSNGTVYLLDAAEGAIRWETRLEVKKQDFARAEQAGPIAFVPATSASPAFLAVAQSADARSRGTLFGLSLDGSVVGSREMEAEGQAIAVVRTKERALAVIGAGLGMYAVEAVPAK